MTTQLEKERWVRETEIFNSIREGWYRTIERTAGRKDGYKTFSEFFKNEILIGDFDLIVEGACGSNGFPCLDILALGYRGRYLRVDEAGPCPPGHYRRWLSETSSNYPAARRLGRKYGLPDDWSKEKIEFVHSEVLLGRKVKELLREAKNPLLLSNLALVRSLKIHDFAWYDWRDFDELPYKKQIHIHPIFTGPVISSVNAELVSGRFNQVDLGGGLVAVDLISTEMGSSEEHYDIYSLRKCLAGFKEYGWRVSLPFQDCLILTR